MGETVVKIKVSNLTDKKSTDVEVLVDSGATYTTIPEPILQKLGIEVVDKITIELADGRLIERNIGNAIVEVEGKVRSTPILFGQEGDATIMGLVTLEACGLTVDTVNRKLVPLLKIHHYRLFFTR